MRKVITFSFVLFIVAALVSWAAVPTTLNDFFLPGSQPGQSGNLEHPAKCDNCHGGYDLAVEPAFNWRGSMMSQAARDPLYFACLAISNQDAPDCGDLCIRCHSPSGWLEGRSVPTDGSALNSNDRESVQCDFCHKLVKPTPLGVNPYPLDPDYVAAGTFAQDQAYLATITAIPSTSANGMYVADANNAKRGPFLDAAARHQIFYSPFHREAALCGTCHDVSNPAFVRNADDTYSPNAFDAPAPNFDPYTMFPVERTFSEWKMSEYNTTGVLAPQFGGNKSIVHTCQDCHLRDVTGMGCNKRGAPARPDLPLHDMTGGNMFIPNLVKTLFPGEYDPAALDAGVLRAQNMLRLAASLNVTMTQPTPGGDYLASVRVTNETGHKLPSGYPEGRRLWLNVKIYDAGGLIQEYGAYNSATGDLVHDTKIYEIKPGISADLAPIVGLPVGPSFHFVLNNQIFSDNRIPPRGFTNANFQAIQSPPVNYSYADGQYWDDTEFTIPTAATQVITTLYYQTTTREYVEFLRDENVTNNWGQVFYDLWVANGRSAPVAMIGDTTNLVLPPIADFAGAPTAGSAPLTVTFTDLSTNSPTSWLWDFGDAGTSTERNPTHTYTLEGSYTVSLTATNAYGSNTKTKPGYITVTPVGVVMHVHAIAVSRELLQGNRANGLASVTIVDAGLNPVSGATVTGNFTGPTSETVSATTGANGIAVLRSRAVKNPVGVWCFAVTGVAKAGATYDPGANVVTGACEGGAAAKDYAEAVPDGFMLAQNYPNPFNPTTDISLYLPEGRHVKLEVFNIIGQRMATLVDGYLESGHHSFIWDGSDAPSGVYLYRLQTGQFTETRKMILHK